MLTHLEKSQFIISGEKGLPEDYPTPKNINNLLFYIQRNLNKNTIVYSMNKTLDGQLHKTYPMKVFWIKYTYGGIEQELNYIQNKAFGYTSKWINDETFEFVMDSYNKLRFFVAKNPNNQHKIITKINNEDCYLSNIYVYANELGLFPDVRYIELYGNNLKNGFPSYQRILI